MKGIPVQKHTFPTREAAIASTPVNLLRSSDRSDWWLEASLRAHSVWHCVAHNLAWIRRRGGIAGTSTHGLLCEHDCCRLTKKATTLFKRSVESDHICSFTISHVRLKLRKDTRVPDLPLPLFASSGPMSSFHSLNRESTRGNIKNFTSCLKYQYPSSNKCCIERYADWPSLPLSSLHSWTFGI